MSTEMVVEAPSGAFAWDSGSEASGEQGAKVQSSDAFRSGVLTLCLAIAGR